jgi:glycosyltransferase involved in cell wall biosynthesis
MSLPLISVVIPTHNHGRFLSDAVNSVLTQTYSNIEVIIVENGSTDTTSETLGALQDPRITSVTLDQNGAALARNVGVDRSHGEFLAFLDADDYWLPSKLSQQVELLLELSPESLSPAMCFTHIQEFIDMNSNNLGIEPRRLIGPSVISMLTSRQSFDRIGKFNESLLLGEFIDWYDRARAINGREVTIPHTLVMRRVHDHNARKMHLGPTGATQGYASTIKSILDRRRSQDR